MRSNADDSVMMGGRQRRSGRVDGETRARMSRAHRRPPTQTVLERRILILLMLLREPLTRGDLTDRLVEAGAFIDLPYGVARDDKEWKRCKHLVDRDVAALGRALETALGTSPLRTAGRVPVRGKRANVTEQVLEIDLAGLVLGEERTAALGILQSAISQGFQGVPLTPGSLDALGRLLGMSHAWKEDETRVPQLYALTAPGGALFSKVEALHKSIQERCVVRFDYQPPSEGKGQIIGSPYALLLERGVPYLHAMPQGSGKVNRFALDRIVTKVDLYPDLNFEPRPLAAKSKVQIRVSDHMKQVIGSRLRIEGQSWSRDGEMWMLSGVSDNELDTRRLVLGWGSHAELVQPKPWRKNMAREINKMATFYVDSGDG